MLFIELLQEKKKLLFNNAADVSGSKGLVTRWTNEKIFNEWKWLNYFSSTQTHTETHTHAEKVLHDFFAVPTAPKKNRFNRKFPCFDTDLMECLPAKEFTHEQQAIYARVSCRQQKQQQNARKKKVA